MSTYTHTYIHTREIVPGMQQRDSGKKVHARRQRRGEKKKIAADDSFFLLLWARVCIIARIVQRFIFIFFFIIGGSIGLDSSIRLSSWLLGKRISFFFRCFIVAAGDEVTNLVKN